MAPEPFVVVRANEYAMRTSNKHLPYGPHELAADAAACEDAGAAMYHFHARDPETGAPRWDTASYREAMVALRDATSMALMPTLGASTVPDPLDRLQHIIDLCANDRTRPDLVPIDMGSFNVDPYDASTSSFRNEEIAYVTPVRALRQLIERCNDLGVRPVPVAWNIGSLRLIDAFVELGILTAPLYIELTLSDVLLSTHPASSEGLRAYVDHLPAHDLHWTALHYGGDIGELNEPIAAAGGGLAIGLGDHPHSETMTNAQLVTRCVASFDALGCQPAPAARFHQLFGQAAMPAADS